MIKRSNISRIPYKSKSYYVGIVVPYFAAHMTIWLGCIIRNNNLIWLFHVIQLQLIFRENIHNQVKADCLIHFMNWLYVIKRLEDLMKQLRQLKNLFRKENNF